ncbi:Domain of uncharacterised function (DUF397) [Nocardia otitidiscaviarum]|uniref:Domain of uncharacterized function (DUF397) n=1 Tax=Nocardia otitidiscaviarum TaxID=1823 RepID=A0A378X8F7_9NOCA|nr:DUF397 domain-containing protein [Nocardia otitidiscaviarum]SUA49014.1 Domain of uncharacterised function (DUF397) [Nocardia otitidiscaviarum]
MINNPPVGQWFKSSRSEHASACVEIKFEHGGVAVRDSKNPGGPVLNFDGVAWDRFVDSGIWER